MAVKRPVSNEEVEKQAARPLPYFSHDSDAASDIKMRRLLRRCGFEGYGRWWRLCELMAQTDGHAVPVSTEEDAEILADELGFDGISDLMDWLNLVEDVGLIDVDRLGEGEVWSARMGKNARFVGMQRACGRLGGRPKGSTKKSA